MRKSLQLLFTAKRSTHPIRSFMKMQRAPQLMMSQYQFRFMSTNLFDTYFKSLQDAKKGELDDLVAKMEDFSKIIYENLETVSQKEVAEALQQLYLMV
jgi:hypothetical protein